MYRPAFAVTDLPHSYLRCPAPFGAELVDADAISSADYSPAAASALEEVRGSPLLPGIFSGGALALILVAPWALLGLMFVASASAPSTATKASPEPTAKLSLERLAQR